MQKDTKDWMNEVEYLTNTQRAIDKKINLINTAIEERRPIVEEMKYQYTHQTRDLDYYEKSEVYQRIDEFMIYANEQLQLAEELGNQRSKPYFARVDFVDSEGKIKVYIGLKSVEDGQDYYVIDWRAPIGELFYDYGKGPASFETPEGVVSGEVTLKRQYDIEKGVLNDVFDVDINIFDEYLQKVLAKVNTDKLHNLVSTIQREQNAIIRNLKNDLLVVQGCVGSGKTTVALHRIAYILYKLPNVESSNVLIISPNELFTHHISGVLPELGEKNTRSATFTKFVKRLLKLPGEVESQDEFANRIRLATTETKQEVNSKLSNDIRNSLVKFVKLYDSKIKFRNGFVIRSQEYSRQSLDDMWHNKFSNETMPKKFNLILEQICKDCNIKSEKTINAVRDELDKRISHKVDMYSVYNAFLRKNKFAELGNINRVNYDDAILLCVLREIYDDVNVKMDIKQIVIDEAQEYPRVFVELLMRIFPRAQFSLFGDDYQQTTPCAVSSLTDFLSLRERDNTYAVLDKTYRSTEEIMQYADDRLGLSYHNAFRLGSNNPVEEITMASDVNQVSQQVLGILEKVIPAGNNIGIIVGDVDFSTELYQELQKVIPHRIANIVNSHISSDRQVQILPVSIAKGLEYDTVIVIENGGLLDSQPTPYHYIAYTRAINKLFVIKK